MCVVSLKYLRNRAANQNDCRNLLVSITSSLANVSEIRNIE